MTNPRFPLSIALRALFLIALMPSALLAGNGALNWLVVYDPGDPDGVAQAQHFAEKRELPASHLVAYDFPRTGGHPLALSHRLSAADAWQLVLHLRGHIAAHGLEGQVNGVALAGLAPTQYIPVGNAFPSFSMTTALMMAPGTASADELENRILNHNPAVYRGPDNGSFLPFRETAEIRSDIDYGGESYWLSMHLGYTGLEGLRLAEAIALIDRSVAADGTAPRGTVYWPLNNNIRAIERSRFIEFVTPEWDALGLRYHVEGLGEGGVNPPRTVPLDKNEAPGGAVTERAAQGIIAGTSQFDLPNSGTMLSAGAIAEHLTSVGGSIGGAFTSSQTPMTEWLRAGASGTSGTVSEPFLTYTKFPHPRIHSHYFRGASLAEAFAQSVQAPVQTLLMGDPLTQPYARIPALSITAPAAGASVSGVFEIAVSKGAAVAVEDDLDLFVNGRRIDPGEPSEPVDAERTGTGFRIDSTTLPEGANTLTVLAYAADAIRTQGRADTEILVDNLGAGLTLSAPPDVTDGAVANLSIQANALPVSTDRVELRFLGRPLGQTGPSGGSLGVPAEALARVGPSWLRAVAVDASGTELVRSTRRSIERRSTPIPALAEFAANPGALAIARIFLDARSPGFDWTQTPDATLPVEDRFALNFDGSDDYPFLSNVSGSDAGIEFVTLFTARQSDVYDLAFRSFPEFSLLINGQTVFDESSSGDTTLHRAVHLAAGTHELRIRIRFVGGNNRFEAGFRSAYSVNRSGSAPEIAGHDYFDRRFCVAPAGVPADRPRLAARADGLGGAAFTWAHGLPGVASWRIESLRAAPEVQLQNYLGTATAPQVIAPGSLESLAPGAPVSVDGDDRYMETPEAYQHATRLLTSAADADDRGRNILYEVSVPAGVTVLAFIDAASDSARPDWMTDQGNWSFVAQESTTEQSSAWRTWRRGPLAEAGTIELGGPRRNDGAITFLFLYETAWQIEGSGIASGSGSTSLADLGLQPRLFRIVAAAGSAITGVSAPLHLILDDAGNPPPAIDLAKNWTVAAPNQPVTLSASVIDDQTPTPGLTLNWTRLSGPGTVGFTDANAASTPATFSAPGEYQLQLSASDGSATSLAETTVHVLPPLSDNAAPIVDAGPNRNLTLTQTASLSGSVSDDARPLGLAPQIRWSLESGPGTVNFLAPRAANTLAYFDTPGAYVLRLTADDGALLSSDTVSVSVSPDPNSPPTVDVGPDLEFFINRSNQLTGLVGDDGLPNPPGSLSVLWRPISGPGTILFAQPTSPQTGVEFSEIGLYEVELRADDSTRFGSDRLRITVSFEDDGNTPPTNTAGSDRQLYLPATALTSGAEASDDGLPDPPATLSHTWELVSGPGNLRYELIEGGPNAALRFDAAGLHTLRLLTSDGAASASDTIEVEALPAPSWSRVFAWGANIRGQLGDLDPQTGLDVPTGVAHGWVQVAPSNQFSLALDDDGSVLAAGRNNFGQLGETALSDRSHFRTIPALPPAQAVASGGTFGAALDREGRIWTWGSNANGELGDGTSTSRAQPLPLAGLTEVIALSAGASNMHVIRDDGSLLGWGRNLSGQLGDGSQTLRRSPVTITGLPPVRAVASGNSHSLFLARDGRTYACGQNFDGQLGNASTNPALTPISVPGLIDIQAVAVGDSHSLALREDGSLLAWGGNNFGQLGDGSTQDRVSPVAVTGLSGVIDIAASGTTSLAVTADGTVWVWGSGFLGEFGNDNNGPTSRSVPAPVPGLSDIRAIRIGGGSIFALQRGPRYTDFAREAFSPAQLDDPTISGIEADPDFDGRSNRIEYFFATDPLVPDQPEQSISFQSGSLFMESRHLRAPDDLEFFWRTSTDLIQWNPADPQRLERIAEGDLQRTRFHFTPSIQNNREFIRADEGK